MKRLVFCVTAKGWCLWRQGHGQGCSKAGASTLFFDPPRCVSDQAALPFFVGQATTHWDQRGVTCHSQEAGVTAKRLVFMAARAGASTLFFNPPRGVSDWAALPFFVKQATTCWDQLRVTCHSQEAGVYGGKAMGRAAVRQAHQLSSSIRHAAFLIGQHFPSSSSRPPHAGTVSMFL